MLKAISICYACPMLASVATSGNAFALYGHTLSLGFFSLLCIAVRNLGLADFTGL